MNVQSFGAGTGPVDLKVILSLMAGIGGGLLIWLYFKGYIGGKRR
jgi:hypothetical protein